MFGLTQLGILHTLLSLVAVGIAIVTLLRQGELRVRTSAGLGYVIATALTCLTGFGIFQHGGFGAPHVLGILTLVVLALAYLAGTRHSFGKASRYVEVIGLSLTVFFHSIPGVTETLTRLPLGAPVLPNADASALKIITGIAFGLFLIGAVWQCRRLRQAGSDNALPGSQAVTDLR